MIGSKDPAYDILSDLEFIDHQYESIRPPDNSAKAASKTLNKSENRSPKGQGSPLSWKDQRSPQNFTSNLIYSVTDIERMHKKYL